MDFYNSHIRVDLDALTENFRNICQKAGSPVMAVIKADGYGHGSVALAKALENQAAFFGVANISEALELRYAGIQLPILVLSRMPRAAFPQAVKYGIRPALFLYDDAAALSAEAQKQGKTAAFHIAVDTGMNRIGVPVTETAADTCVAMAQLPGLEAEGIFSHFATADTRDLTRTHAQMAKFDTFLTMLKHRGLEIPICHLNNSAGIMDFSAKYHMARSGIILYGLYPSDEVDPAVLRLRPILSWVSHIAHLKAVPAGQEIGYGGTFTTDRPSRIATIPVGYADGYRRNLSNRFHVLIRGRKAPIVGRICMDQFMVDVTDIPDVCIEDAVTLIGVDGSECITAEDMAEALGTINYEITCGISRRVPRTYLQGGKRVHTLSYLPE